MLKTAPLVRFGVLGRRVVEIRAPIVPAIATNTEPKALVFPFPSAKTQAALQKLGFTIIRPDNHLDRVHLVAPKHMPGNPAEIAERIKATYDSHEQPLMSVIDDTEPKRSTPGK